MFVFRQLFDPQSSTYTYLLADRAKNEAVLIEFDAYHREHCELQIVSKRANLSQGAGKGRAVKL